ncbi:MAG: hypothetical protein MJ064_09840, partial [Lachnospiraceae bacterium]|nr:hypothetical protein [Lachnospiraceae bacterium]
EVCRQEVQQKHESKRMYNVDAKMMAFLNDVLSWYGCPTDYVEMCDEENLSLSERLSVTLAIREKKVDFGYIHGVNIEKNIRDIYREVVVSE